MFNNSMTWRAVQCGGEIYTFWSQKFWTPVLAMTFINLGLFASYLVSPHLGFPSVMEIIESM